MIGYIYAVGIVLGFLPTMRAVMRFFIADVGLDDGFDIFMTWALSACFGLAGAACWPVLAPIAVAKHFYRGDAGEFTRRMAGQSREQKLEARERAVRDRERAIARLEQATGYSPIE